VRRNRVWSHPRPRSPALRLASALAAAVLGLAACGSQAPATLRTGSVARAIAASIRRQFGITTTVTCPANPPEQSGYRFACTARLAVGAYIVTVHETDAHGTVSYRGSGPLRALDSARIERAIRSAMGHGRGAAASVHCPSPVLQRSGLTFTCTARTRAGAVLRFTVRQDDGNGRVTLVGA